MEQLKKLIRKFQNLSFKKVFAYFIYKIAPYMLLLPCLYPGLWGLYMFVFGGGYELDRGFFDFLVFFELMVFAAVSILSSVFGMVMAYEWAKKEIKNS